MSSICTFLFIKTTVQTKTTDLTKKTHNIYKATSLKFLNNSECPGIYQDTHYYVCMREFSLIQLRLNT